MYLLLFGIWSYNLGTIETNKVLSKGQFIIYSQNFKCTESETGFNLKKNHFFSQTASNI